MDYNDWDNDCEVNDLLSDLSFRNWVLNPDSDSNLFWESWLMQNPEKKEAVKQARILLKSLQFQESKLTDDKSSLLLRRIQITNALRKEKDQGEAVVRPLNDGNKHIQQKRRRAPMRTLLRYAAVLGGAIIVALSANLILGGFENGKAVQYVERVNDRGQKTTIFLPDGSLVTLNSSSQLVFPTEFEDDTREVYLKGEAFFDVKKGSKPFIVKTENIKAKVLGTSFNVRSFPGNPESSISLVTGKVVVSPSENDPFSLVLEPGEKGKWDRETALLVKEKFDYEEEAGWREGILLLKDLPFKEALHRVEQWYGIEFVVDQMPRQDYQITGRFENESLENVLKSISFTLRFDYQIKENKVYLNFKN